VLVYGDRPRHERPAALIAEIEARLAGLPSGGMARHAAVVEAFIVASELAQGLADAEFAARGEDAQSPVQDAAMAVVMALAERVVASPSRPREREPLAALAALALPETIETRAGEGYAFYALYPEAYAEAARQSGLPPDTTVIGIRSIGLGLAAVVAAALGAPPPVSVRPVGHPFRRTLALSPALEARLRESAAGWFAVVDEGPGLSGSSFASVATALEALGADPGRIVFFPSHAGEPGPQADAAWRARWRAARKPLVGFEPLLIESGRLERWAAELLGEPIAPLEDLSGGAWRARLHPNEASWPAANTYQERRKFLMRTGEAAWLLKFAGLGRDGGAKLARARALAEAGFTPPVAALSHGFLVERWIEGARPLDPDAFGRDRLLAHLARYLGFRARAFPAAPEAGASLSALHEMARVNTAEALGSAAAARLPPERTLAGLQARVRRVETDNRLHRPEWLVAPDGRLLKADAVDHAHAHDLVGAQDLAWDVAGAAAELDLTAAEAEALAEAAGADRDLLAFLTPAYLAFQLGAFAMAAEAHAGWPEERRRLEAARDGYAARLSQALVNRDVSTRAARLA
jgi:hypothetical protein